MGILKPIAKKFNLKLPRRLCRGRGLYQVLLYVALICCFILSLQLPDSLSECSLFKIHSSSIFWVRPYFFCTNMSGDIGRQMFQYAFLVAMKIRYSSDVIIPKNSILTSAFDINAENEVILKYCECFKEVQVSSTHMEINEDLFRVDRRFSGNFFNYRYFDKHKKELTARFRMRKWLKILVQSDITKILIDKKMSKDSTKLIGIYIGGFKFQNIVSKLEIESFLLRARENMRSKYSNALFIIVLDARENSLWLKNFLKYPDVVCQEYVQDELSMGFLMQMDGSIVIEGTIAWWGAWLSGGSVIYFQHSKFQEENKINPYPESWEAISVA